MAVTESVGDPGGYFIPVLRPLGGRRSSGRVEKTKGTKPIGKIKLTPVTLPLCNWRNLN